MGLGAEQEVVGFRVWIWMKADVKPEPLGLRLEAEELLKPIFTQARQQTVGAKSVLLATT